MRKVRIHNEDLAETNQGLVLYVEALEEELARVASDIARAQQMYPDLKHLRVNPNTTINKQV